MKMLAATVAFATLLPSAALAQYGGPYRSYGQQIRPRADFYNSYGYYGARGPVNWGIGVYDTSGKFVGADPDPRVRSMLALDNPANN